MTGRRRYRRDTNVMPQWAGSCWYELRYCDPTNENAFVDPEVERYWMGPQTDVRPTTPAASTCTSAASSTPCCTCCTPASGTRCCSTSGHVSSQEPYARLFNQGYVLAAAYTDERGMYVEADDVVSRAGRHVHVRGPARSTREWGKMGKSLKNAVVARGDLRGLRQPTRCACT